MFPAESRPAENRVSRRRYERERKGRKQAELLLEAKSRELFDVNAVLMAQTSALEQAVADRTQELELAKTAAETASDAKSSFLAMISHEIRTPLNGVLGMAAALSEGDLEPEQKEMAEVIQSCGMSLLDLLNDMLDLSKIEANKIELEERDFDLAEFLNETQKIYAKRAELKGLEFKIRRSGENRDWLCSDPTRLRQVVTNLLSNAFKFTQKGNVTLEVYTRGNHLVISVRDTGPGVPEDKRDRLFEAFSQTDASITRKFGGTGLGLTISRKICQLMGGDLVYEPAPGGGSCFVATVEIRPARSKAPHGNVGGDRAEDILTRGNWRILAAEDSMTNQRVLHLLLKKYQLQIDMVEDGRAAVEAHFQAPYDLILMDVNMPEMNGLEAAAMIREVEAARDLPRVPIIALTANAMTHQVSDYLRRGIDAHVSKPVRREDLCSEMGRLLAPQAE